MGLVLAARHRDLGELVAIKLLRSDATDHSMSRFLREARAAARISSNHAVKVHDVGRLPDHTPYMVMEYLEGSDLHRVLKRRGALPLGEAGTLVLQACDAIAEAHTLGIVHRDLKPANLFLTRRRDGSPCLKVLDFGIMKQLDDKEELTSSGLIIGTPLYMSPEQLCDSKSVDARSDIWAMGVVLYELTTGQVPFKRSSLPDLFSHVSSSGPTPPSQLFPELPPMLDEVIDRCLRRDRAERYATIEELAAAVRPLTTQSGSPPLGRRVQAPLPRDVGPTPEGQRRSERAQPTVPPAPILERPALELLADTADPPSIDDGSQRASEAPGAALDLAADSVGLVGKRPRWPRWLLSMLGLGAIGALGTSGLRAGGDEGGRLDARPAPDAPAPSLAPPEMACFTGAKLRPGAFEASQRPPTCSALNPAEDCMRPLDPRTPEIALDGYCLDRREVTNQEFASWLDGNPELWHLNSKDTSVIQTRARPRVFLARTGPECGLMLVEGRVRPGPGNAKRPVTCVTWMAARDYCRANGKQLPLELEWEFAAKGSEGRPFPWGAQMPRRDGVAFARGDSAEQRPADVGTSSQDVSPQGVYDLGGNVAEWVAGEGGAGEAATIRGGSWNSRDACRLLGSGCERIPAEGFSRDVGFRCANRVVKDLRRE